MSTIPHPEEVPFDLLSLSGMRRIIGERMTQSVRDFPQFYICMRTDMSAVVALREKLKKSSDVKITFNDIILKATALALREQPRMNCAFSPEGIRVFQEINVGFVVAVEDGVVVPVIRQADKKSLSQIAGEVKALTERARAGKLGARASLGGTFTVSNLGMFDIDIVIPIINPPQAGILGVGAICEMPTVREGKIETRPMCELWLSCDHRAVDGMISSQFLAALKAILQQPEKLAAEI